jgi:hypothetical protein
MGWIRTKTRFGAWCALFALAIQFTLSFGHAHSLASPLGELQRAAVSDAGHSTAMPGAPANPASLAFDYCAICAVVNLTGSAVPAAAPGFAVPFASHTIRFWSHFGDATAAPPHRLFRARAPPLS